MSDKLPDLLKGAKGVIKETRKYAESSTKSPREFNKGGIIVIFLIIFLILAIRVSLFQSNFYEILFFTILFIFLFFMVSYVNIKIDKKPEEKKIDLLKKLEMRDAMTHKYPNPQLDILFIGER